MKLSVIMPVGRVDDFFIQTLESVDKQIFHDFELILVCKSNILNQVHELLESSAYSFKWKLLHTPLSSAFAANLGIAEAYGSQYITRWDSDDLCSSNRFERQIFELDANLDLAVVGSRVDIIDANNIIDSIQKFKFYSSDKEIRTALKYRQPLLHSSLMFRSEILFNNNGYLYGHASEDHELFIRISRNRSIKFKNLPDVTTYYRRHSAQLSDLSSLSRHFHEVSGFMFSEFLKTGSPLYLVGIAVNIPLFRKLRYFYRAIRRKIYGFLTERV